MDEKWEEEEEEEEGVLKKERVSPRLVCSTRLINLLKLNARDRRCVRCKKWFSSAHVRRNSLQDHQDWYFAPSPERSLQLYMNLPLPPTLHPPHLSLSLHSPLLPPCQLFKLTPTSPVFKLKLIRKPFWLLRQVSTSSPYNKLSFFLFYFILFSFPYCFCFNGLYIGMGKADRKYNRKTSTPCFLNINIPNTFLLLLLLLF